MQQILTLHGGTTFAKYEDFLTDLRDTPVHPEHMTFKLMWKDLLQQNLGPDYTVLGPRMPNSTNAQYEEWKIYFDKIARQILEDDCILVGHSLGAIFLVKYLSENEIPITIKATILVAAPHSDESTEDLTDFKLPEELPALFTKQAGSVTLFFGHNDPVIAPIEIESYRKALPDATIIVTDAPDHFVREEFPEILEVIRNANPKQRLISFLRGVIKEEKHQSREALASRIVSELIGDYDDIYEELLENSPEVVRIADIASDLEWSNGIESDLNAMWQELKQLADVLQKDA